MIKPLLVYPDQKQWIDPFLVGPRGAGLLKLKMWGESVVDFIIVTSACKAVDEEEIKNLLGPFLNKNREGRYSVHSDSESFEAIDEDLSLKIVQIKQKNLEAAIVIQKEENSLFDAKGFSRSLKNPSSTTWIEITEVSTNLVSSYRMSYHDELLEKNEKSIIKIDELKNLNQKILRAEQKLGAPCVVEFKKISNTWFASSLLPLDSDFPKIDILVDTNLAESYSGVTSPLTFSLVQKMYTQVLKEAAKTMNFSSVRTKNLEKALPFLINHIDWHLYYNIESYYTVLGNLPTGEKSIEEWHQKIGGKIHGTDSEKHILRYGKIEMLQTLWGMVRIILKQEQVFRGFAATIKDQNKEINDEIESVQTPEEGWELLERLMGRPMGFGQAVINDLFIVVGLRFLTKVLLQKGYKESDLPLLLKTDLELQALRPIEALNHLKRKITQKSWDILVQESVTSNWGDPYLQIYQKLRDHGEGAFARELETFINQYGDRCFEELKLESLSFSQSPELLVKLLDSFYGDKNPYLGISSKPVAISLNFIEKWILQFTRRSLDWRETTRSLRAKFYHLMRKLIVKNAVLMKNNEALYNDFELRDFFSLTAEEWSRWSRKEISDQIVFSLMKEREIWKHLEKSYPEIYFQAQGEPYVHFSYQVDKDALLLKGTGASPGEVSGIALVLQHPEEAFLVKDLENRILVTKNTDPAWVYVMARARGLVSEKGSILSHAAIIGRELKLTTIVGVSDITRRVKTGDKITINGTTGEIFFS